MIDTVVFDLGGVLIEWNPRYLFRKLMTDDSQIERFLREVCNAEWNEKLDAGRSWSEAVAELVATHPDQSPYIHAYWERWNEMMLGEIKGTVEILEQIKRGGKYRLFALSNWSAETFPYAVARFPFLKFFESIVVSGQEKMIKPDAGFFRLLMERHHVEPAKSVFIDDVAKNIAAARALGFHTVHFHSPEDLRYNLADLGLAI